MATVADMLGQMAQPPPTRDATPKAVLGDAAPAAGQNYFDRFDTKPTQLTRSPGQSFGLGLRDVANGAGGLVDMVAGPLNATVNTVTGSHLSTSPTRDVINTVADMLGAPRAQTDSDQMNAAIIGGATQGLVTAGAGSALAGARGAAGVVARQVAAAPLVDTTAGATSGAASEQTRQSGGGPIAQIAAGLAAGGVGGVGAARVAEATERVAASLGPKAAKVITETPPEVLIDPKGDLTPDGREAAARADTHPEQFKAAVKHVQDAQVMAENENVAPTEGETPSVTREAPVAPEGLAQTTPAVETAQPPPELPAAPPEAPAEAYPAGAVDRLSQAQSEGIPLTRGQATQDFAAQDAEQSLRAQPSAIGEQARAFYSQQQDAIQGAVERFKSAFGDTTATAQERGQAVKDALTQLRDSGSAGVSALYEQARQLAEKAGATGSNLVNLDTAPLLARIRQILIDEGVSPQVRTALRQQAAQYGLMGQGQRVFEDGSASVRLAGVDGEPGPTIQLQRPQEPLSIVNAEKFRQFINKQFQDDKTAALQSLKPILDNAVESAVSRAATEAPEGGVGQAFQAARKAYQTQKQTFEAKDVVQRLVDVKKGTNTDVVQAERAIKEVLGSGPEGVTNLKRLKAVLLTQPTAASQTAWRAVQAQGIADIFNQAVTLNANHGSGSLGAISGAKLNSAVAKFGPQKLKVLLGDAEFNQLMKLKRIIGDATIPISGTTNPSGSAYKLMSFLGGVAGRASPLLHAIPGGKLVQGVAHGAGALAKAGKEAAQAKETLAGVREFTPEGAAHADAMKGQPKGMDIAAIQRFLTAGASNQFLSSTVAALGQEHH